MASVLNEWKGNSYVLSVAVSPDSSRIVAGCRHDVVIVDAYSGRTLLGPLEGHTGWINSVAFSPDGHTFASGSDDCTIRLWDAEIGKATIQPLTGHTHYVNSVAYTSDGRLLVSGSRDRTVRLWDARTGQPVDRTIDTGASVWAIAVLPDGMKVAGGCYDDTICMYDTATGTMLFRCTGHTDSIQSVAVSSDRYRLASGSWDHTIRLWDGSTGQAIGSPLEGHTGWVRSVSFSPDGRYVASASEDKTIRIWDAHTRTSQCDPFYGHTDSVWSVAFTPDGSRLISGSWDESIKIWDVQHLEINKPVEMPQPTEPTEPEIRDDPLSFGSNDVGVITESTELVINITAATSAQDIVLHLGARGCIDMTASVDWLSCSIYPISSGGFGDIYRCRLENSIEVAIKTIRIYSPVDEQECKALKWAAREMYTWSKCRHPNIQPLLGLVVFREQIGMVTTWEANGNLSQYLKRHPGADRCIMSTQIADGLVYLHASGVVHGDLKAANVIVSKDRGAQLADFGSAALHEYTLQFSQTSTKTNLTPRWASPELLRGGKCSREADVYALGMTILETVTGEVPWTGKTDMGVQFSVVFEKAIPGRPIAHIPTRSEHGDVLWSLLKSCWIYEPGDRPSAESVAKTLRGITQEGLKPTHTRGSN